MLPTVADLDNVNGLISYWDPPVVLIVEKDVNSTYVIKYLLAPSKAMEMMCQQVLCRKRCSIQTNLLGC